MIGLSPVTKSNSQKPANAWRKIKKSCLPFTTFRSSTHLGTTNPIESTFATGCERDRTEDFELIPKVVTGVRFVNGRLVSNFNKDVPTL